MDIRQQRLTNQHLTGNLFTTASEVVAWLGAVQAQDYAGAKWAVAQRTTGLTNAAIEQAFAAGAILRTHVMRPTWHFVTPEDIRWMLALTAPRVKALNAYYCRKLELDEATLGRSNDVLAKGLQGGNQLTRPELAAILRQFGLPADNLLRIGYIMGQAELDAIICSGALRGKQHTYALLDERAPQARTLERDEALAELTRRYFSSHGPATLPDFVWWSGLTTSDARAGLELAKLHLVREVSDGQTYWLPASPLPVNAAPPKVHLLPAYDEYTVAYKDRTAILDPVYTEQARNGIFNPVIVVGGRIAGTWKRTVKKEAVVIALSLFTSLTEAENQAVVVAAKQYGDFLERPVVLA